MTTPTEPTMADTYLRLKRHLNGVTDIVANLEREYLEVIAQNHELREEISMRQAALVALQSENDRLTEQAAAYREHAASLQEAHDGAYEELKQETARHLETHVRLATVTRVNEELRHELSIAKDDIAALRGA